MVELDVEEISLIEVEELTPALDVDVATAISDVEVAAAVVVVIVDVVALAVEVRQSHTACADFEADRKEMIPSFPDTVEQAALAHAYALATIIFD